MFNKVRKIPIIKFSKLYYFRTILPGSSYGTYDAIALPTARYEWEWLTRVPLVADENITAPAFCNCENTCGTNHYNFRRDTQGSFGQPIIHDIIVELGQVVTVQLPRWCNYDYFTPSYYFTIHDSTGTTITASSFYNAFIEFNDNSPSSKRNLTVYPTLTSQVGTHYLNMKVEITQNSN